jgi:hypothetical protein
MKDKNMKDVFEDINVSEEFKKACAEKIDSPIVEIDLINMLNTFNHSFEEEFKKCSADKDFTVGSFMVDSKGNIDLHLPEIKSGYVPSWNGEKQEYIPYPISENKVEKPLTIIKVLPKNNKPTSQEDLYRWREIFAKNDSSTIKNAQLNCEIEVQHLPRDLSENQIMFVKVGSDKLPTNKEELEEWQKVFEEAKNDPDFMIFTHPDVEVEIVKIGNIVAVE